MNGIIAPSITKTAGGQDLYVPTSGGGGGGGVTQIVAGSNISITPTNGLGAVTINSTGGGGGGSFTDITVTGSSNLNGGITSPSVGTRSNPLIPDVTGINPVYIGTSGVIRLTRTNSNLLSGLLAFPPSLVQQYSNAKIFLSFSYPTNFDPLGIVGMPIILQPFSAQDPPNNPNRPSYAGIPILVRLSETSTDAIAVLNYFVVF